MKPRPMKHASACLGLLAIAATAGAVNEALAQPLSVTYEDVTKLLGRLAPSWAGDQKSVDALLAEKGMGMNA